MIVDREHYRCPRCRRVLPSTADYFYLRAGKVAGYCKECRREVNARYQADHPRPYTPRNRDYMREWHRRRNAITPDRYRGPRDRGVAS